MAARKRDPAVLLAEQLVQALRQLATAPDGRYPVTLHELAQRVDPRASPRMILAAAGPRRKEFSQHALVARADLLAPVALLEDLPRLATSALLLEYVLEVNRTASNQAFTPSVLRSKVTGKLQKPFQEALLQQIDAGTLPTTVGWVLVTRSKKLFLMRDLHQGHGGDTNQPAPATTTAIQAFGPAFEKAFTELDRRSGGHNFVSLAELRQAIGVERSVFDEELRQLRALGEYSLSAAEGRHGLSEADRAAGILEDGTLLLYVSRKAGT